MSRWNLHRTLLKVCSRVICVCVECDHIPPSIDFKKTSVSSLLLAHLLSLVFVPSDDGDGDGGVEHDPSSHLTSNKNTETHNSNQLNSHLPPQATHLCHLRDTVGHKATRTRIQTDQKAHKSSNNRIRSQAMTDPVIDRLGLHISFLLFRVPYSPSIQQLCSRHHQLSHWSHSHVGNTIHPSGDSLFHNTTINVQ